MKKIMSVLICIIFIMVSFVIFDNNQREMKQIDAYNKFSLNNNYMHFNIPHKYITTKTKYKKLINDLNLISHNQKVNYLKREYYQSYDQKNGKLQYASPIDIVHFQISDTKPTNLYDRFNMEPHKVLKETHNLTPNIVNGLSMYINPINETINNHNDYEGDFYLETHDINKYKSFLNELAQKLSSPKHLIKYDNLSYDSKYNISPHDLDLSEINVNEGKIINIMIVSLIIATIVYILLSTREIGIYNMNGYNTYDITRKLVLNKLSLSLIISILFLILIYGFDINSVIQQLILFVSTIVISLLMIFILNKLAIAKYINNRNYTGYTIIPLFVVKSLLVFMSFTLLIPIIQITGNLNNVFLNNKNRNNNYEKNYGIFYPDLVGNNSNDITLSSQKQLDHSAYGYFNKNGALLLNTDDYIGLNNDINDDLKAVILNPRLFNQFKIKDINNKMIHIPVFSKDNKLMLIIPINKRNETRSIIKTNQQNEFKYFKKNLQHNIIYINKNEHFFDMNENKWMKDKTILISNPNNSSFVDRSILDGNGSNEPLKIPIHNNLRMTYKKYYNFLYTHNLLDNKPQLVRERDISLEDLKMSIGDIKIQLFILLFTLLIDLILMIYTIDIYMNFYGKSIFVKRINGYGIIQSYWLYWLLLCSQYVLIQFLVMQSYNVSFSILTFMMFIIETLISLYTIIKSEYNKIWGNINE